MRPRLALRAARSESSISRERYTARLSLSSIAFWRSSERLDRTVGRLLRDRVVVATASGRWGPPAARRRTRVPRGPRASARSRPCRGSCARATGRGRGSPRSRSPGCPRPGGPRGCARARDRAAEAGRPSRARSPCGRRPRPPRSCTRVRYENPRTVWVRARFGARSVALRAASSDAAPSPRDERISARRAHASASFGSSVDGLLEALPRALEVELRLLCVGERDQRRRRLRVGRDGLLRRGERLVGSVRRHLDDRLQGEGVGVLRSASGPGRGPCRVLHAARGEEERRAVGEELGPERRRALEARTPSSRLAAPADSRPWPAGRARRSPGFAYRTGQVVERPLDGVLGVHRDGAHRRASLARPRPTWPASRSRPPASVSA